MTPPVTVEVLVLAGCPHAGETLALVRETAARLLPGAVVRETRVDEAAAGPGFPGSPTVLVNGRDVAGRGPGAAGPS
jgi:hypothetical protein